jgi:hypothetical protein
VLEIALVRLARREAGTPLQALAERVDRLERGPVANPVAAPRPADDAAAAPARPGGAERSARSFAELRRQRTEADPQLPSAPSSSESVAPEAEGEPEPEPALDDEPIGEVDIDDVIVAWAEILPELPPATRAAVREAQPLAVDAGVITFGVPKAHYETALPRFKKEADNIRAALSRRLGRAMRFKSVPHDGFEADPAPTNAAGDEEPPPGDDEVLDLAELVDGDHDAPSLDSVSLITQSLGATVVEEVPRD